MFEFMKMSAAILGRFLWVYKAMFSPTACVIMSCTGDLINIRGQKILNSDVYELCNTEEDRNSSKYTIRLSEKKQEGERDSHKGEICTDSHAWIWKVPCRTGVDWQCVHLLSGGSKITVIQQAASEHFI